MNLKSVKNYVYKHRVAFAVAGTALLAAAIMYRNSKLLDEFLKEHNLYEEYYAEV